jgi:tetratricopeptide (TPR) repeat protein
VPTPSGPPPRPAPRAAPCVALALAAAIAVSWTPVAAQRPPEPTPADTTATSAAWIDAVSTHRPRETDPAFRLVGAWSADRTRAVVVAALPSMNTRLLQRALMLHTDLAIAEQGATRPPSGGPTFILVVDGRAIGEFARPFQWSLARLIALRLARKPDGFASARDWLRAASAIQQTWSDNSSLLEHLHEALRQFPDDAVLLLHWATLRQDFANGRTQAFLRETKQYRRQGIDTRSVELLIAERTLRRAVALDPALVEARIRLAHVLLDRGKPADALALAGPALDEALPPFLEYYAALVLGRSAAQVGELDRATLAFERAAHAFPRAQAPRIALSHLALRRGAAADGLAAVTGLAEPASVERDDDPWWLHRQYHEPRAEVLFEAWVAGLS